jgi:hypothetical protein
MNIFEKLSDAFFDGRVLDTFDVLDRYYFLIACITAVDADKFFLTFADE